MKAFSLLLFLIGSISVCAQNATTITIKAGEDVNVLYKHIYKYPEFTYGKVFFNDGTVVGSKMNYNLFLQAIQFIDEKGDTLALANENTVKHITIGADTFYYQGAYLQLISKYGETKLVAKQAIKFLDEKNIGTSVPG